MATRIEPGDYTAKALAWAFGMTNTNKPQIAVTFELLDGDVRGTKLTWYGFLHDEKSGKRTMSSMRSCGWDGTGPITEAQGLDANEVRVVVEDNDWEGEVSSRIAWVNSIGPAVKALTDAQKASLNQRMADWQKPAGTTQTQQRRAPPPRAPAPPPVANGEAGAGDDDIPF